MRPHLDGVFSVFAPGHVCWAHPVNVLQSVLGVCQAAASSPERRAHPRPERVWRQRYTLSAGGPPPHYQQGHLARPVHPGQHGKNK